MLGAAAVSCDHDNGRNGGKAGRDEGRVALTIDLRQAVVGDTGGLGRGAVCSSNRARFAASLGRRDILLVT